MRSTSRLLKQLREKKIAEKERNTIRRLEFLQFLPLRYGSLIEAACNHLYSQVSRAFIFNVLVLIQKVIFTQKISMDIFNWNMTQWYVNIQEKSESKNQHFIFFPIVLNNSLWYDLIG